MSKATDNDVNSSGDSSVTPAAEGAASNKDVNNEVDSSATQAAKGNVPNLSQVLAKVLNPDDGKEKTKPKKSAEEGESQESDNENLESEEKNETDEQSDEQSDEEGSEEQNQDEEETDEEDESEETENEKSQAPVPYKRFTEINERLKQTQKQFDQIKDFADAQKGLIEYCQSNNVTPEEFQRFLSVAALVKSDPAKALEALQPLIDDLQSYTGDRLPEDLQKAVDDGEMSLAMAKRLVAAEGKSKFGSQQLEQTKQQAQAQAQTRRQQALYQSLTNWVSTKQASDPEFMPKKSANSADGALELWATKLALAVKGEPIEDASQLIAEAEKCYLETKKVFGRFKPKVNGMKKVDSGRSGASKAQEPKSLAEALTLSASRLDLSK